MRRKGRRGKERSLSGWREDPVDQMNMREKSALGVEIKFMINFF